MKGQRAIELTPHAKLRLEQRVKHPEGYPDWKTFATAARNKGKKLNDLSPEEKHYWLKYHGRGLGAAASVPYFYKDYCFIFRKIHKVPHLITVYKNPIKDASETPSQEKI